MERGAGGIRRHPSSHFGRFGLHRANGSSLRFGIRETRSLPVSGEPGAEQEVTGAPRGALLVGRGDRRDRFSAALQHVAVVCLLRLTACAATSGCVSDQERETVIKRSSVAYRAPRAIYRQSPRTCHLLVEDHMDVHGLRRHNRRRVHAVARISANCLGIWLDSTSHMAYGTQRRRLLHRARARIVRCRPPRIMRERDDPEQ